jgi:hypothetical protein
MQFLRYAYFWHQGGQEYARRAELRELARIEEAEKEKVIARATSEKDKKE